MNDIRIGDIVARKSYRGDVYFRVSDTVEKEDGTKDYILKGIEHRLIADSKENDLFMPHPQRVFMQRHNHIIIRQRKLYFEELLEELFKNKYSRKKNRRKAIPGRILYLDADEKFSSLNTRYLRRRGIEVYSYVVSEQRQHQVVRSYIERHNPDMIIFTGHDGIRSNATDIYNMNSYAHSRFFVQAVRAARAVESDVDKLYIFAGACQSYFEAIMSAGANFASSPGRILTYSYDSAIVSGRIARTDSEVVITPEQAVRGTYSGAEGIGGIDTRGRMTWE